MDPQQQITQAAQVAVAALTSFRSGKGQPAGTEFITRVAQDEGLPGLGQAVFGLMLVADLLLKDAAAHHGVTPEEHLQTVALTIGRMQE